MAACIVEETSGATPIYCQTSHTMERTSSSSSPLETSTRTTTANPEHHRCLFNFHTTNLHLDSTLMINQESTSRKRRISQTDVNKDCETKRTVLDSSRRLQPDSIDKNHQSAITPIRPKTLSLTNTKFDSPFPNLRTFLSIPSTTPTDSPITDNNELSPLKFRSLPELNSPSAKRLRPQTLSFAPLSPSITTSPIQTIAVPPKLPTSISFISPTELADKLKEKIPLTIFDCGSPIRHSEHRVRNSILLRVANKISRKRLKTNSAQQSTIDIKQLNESQHIILYDDKTNIRRQNSDSSCVNTDGQLSSALKCAREEVQRYLTTNSPPILILNCPFSQFFDLYPNLCEALQPRSCPSSPTNHTNDSYTPQTAPPVHKLFLLPTTTTTTATSTITPSQNDIDNYPMTHILDGLYIGSESNAKNLDELYSEQIRCIVNVTSHVPLYHSEHFQYCHLPADDSQKQSLLEHFDQAYSFIHEAIQKNEKVLVHCVAGISRSPAIVIGFLMRYAKMNMNEAYDFVKRKRSIVSPNLNFMGQLLEYEKKLRHEK